jgi:hypothetical protein
MTIEAKREIRGGFWTGKPHAIKPGTSIVLRDRIDGEKETIDQISLAIVDGSTLYFKGYKEVWVNTGLIRKKRQKVRARPIKRLMGERINQEQLATDWRFGIRTVITYRDEA